MSMPNATENSTPENMTPELALQLVRQAESLSREELGRIQDERLHFLLNYARQHSPFLGEKYKDLPEKPSLAQIPILERSEAVANFNGWMADPQVTSAALDEFLAEPQTMLQDFLGRYRVLSTSGSTAAPLRIVRDSRHNQINAALMQSRFWGSGKVRDIPALKEPWPRICAITAGGGRHSSYLSFLRTAKAYEQQGLADRATFISIETPLPQLLATLNEAQPQIIGSYPSILQVLAKARQDGKLRIQPLALCSSAEYLDPDVRQLLEDTFQCPVMDNYCSTEGGEVAMLCSANHLHVNSDWLILEPVDTQNRPVTEGLSDGLLLTNLANLVQPIIRYRISDRAMLNNEPCSCGSPFPTLSIEGRKEDILEFPTKDGPFRLSPPVLMVAALHIPGCAACQFIQHEPLRLEIRCEPLETASHSDVLGALQAKTAAILAANGVENTCITTSSLPLQRGKSGKLRVFVKNFA